MHRVALVTGSASGLGVQTVLALAREGHQIMINYRSSREKAYMLQEQVRALGVNCGVVQGDVSRKEDCREMVSQTIRQFGRIDMLINNAGPYIFERKKLVEYTDEEWDLMINGNLSSVFYLMREVIPLMRQNKWGRIITFGFNQASQATSWMYRAAFASAKVGLVSLTKTLAQEECESGITVNMICPGDIIGNNKQKSISEAKDQEEGTNLAPIGRPGSGEDVARVVRFLCAEDSDFITGSIIEVNGGLNVMGKRVTRNKKATKNKRSP